MFDDEAEDVGSDIEAYCPKCKTDTSHTVITKYEEEVRRVQCSVCGDVHTFRKPRGEVDDESPEPVAAKKRAMAKKPSWTEAKDRAGNKGIASARPYSIRDTYTEGDVVTHPKFGLGFVTEITENKVEITFEDERRVLIHNRPDLAAVMPAIAQIPAPREEKKKGKKGGKGKGGKEAKVEAPPPPPPAPVAPPAKADKGKAAKAAPAAPAPAPAAKAAPVKAVPAAKADKGKAAAPAKAAPAAKAVPAKAAAKPAGKPVKAAAKKPAPAAKSAKPAAKKAAAKKPAPKAKAGKKR